MVLNSRAFAIIVLIIVLIVSLIQLAISGGIVSNYAQYGNIFARERGLSIFNIVISIFGILISILGLIAVATRRITFSKVIAFGCLFLALCTIGSLIAAVTINFVDAESVNSRFFENMKHYKDNTDARNSVDRIQRNYDCCGSNMWIDWATVPLYAPSSNTNYLQGTGITAGARVSTPSTTTRRTTTQTAADLDWLGDTDVESVADNTDVEEIVDLVTEPTRFTTRSTATTRPITPKMTTKQSTRSQTTKSNYKPTLVDTKQDDDPFSDAASSSFESVLRKKRQASVNYGGSYGLPMSYTVALPQSCCTHDSPSIFNSLDAYCISNANNVQNTYHRSGCANIVTKLAVGQAIAIALINAFLLTFAFLAALVLQRTYSAISTAPKTYRASAIHSQQVHPGGDHKEGVEKTTKTSVINYNTDYSVYQ